MSQATGARLTGVFDPGTSASADIVFLVTGFTLSVEDRPSIDITASSNRIARMVPGRRGNTTVTINARFDSNQAVLMNTDLLQCEAGSLAISAAATDDCDEVYILGSTETTGDPPVTTITGIGAYLMGYTIEATMDSAVDMTLNFMLESNGSNLVDGE